MNIVLIGFRGTGKTTVGKILSKKTGMKFISSDDEIEKNMEKFQRLYVIMVGNYNKTHKKFRQAKINKFLY